MNDPRFYQETGGRRLSDSDPDAPTSILDPISFPGLATQLEASSKAREDDEDKSSVITVFQDVDACYGPEEQPLQSLLSPCLTHRLYCRSHLIKTYQHVKTTMIERIHWN